MRQAGDYILGNGVLHQRFRLATEILGVVALHAPRPLTIARLEEQTGRPAKELTKLCAQLARAHLLSAACSIEDGWLLAAPASSMTLEDVFRCVLDMQTSRAKSVSRTNGAEGVSRDIDLLMMQATMAINQSVFQHLRQFSLDRLKARASSVASFGSFYLSRSSYDGGSDFALI